MELKNQLQWLGVTFYSPNEAEKPAIIARTGGWTSQWSWKSSYNVSNRVVDAAKKLKNQLQSLEVPPYRPNGAEKPATIADQMVRRRDEAGKAATIAQADTTFRKEVSP